MATAKCLARPALARSTPRILSPRWAQTRQFRSTHDKPKVPDFAFAFDIDGVLLRSSTPVPRASEALAKLQEAHIPFILLTNGGGKLEGARVADLSEKLKVPLDTGMFVQSHTPFSQQTDLYDKTALIVGGEGAKCAEVAREYGFKNVVTPGDILVAHPDIWPFSHPFLDHYKSWARPLPKSIDPEAKDGLKVDVIFVFNDPRDWGLDSTVMLDLLLSKQGRLGTLSEKNGKKDLPNSGYLQDGQPEIHFSNPDLWWASSHPLSRLGQGGFRAAFEGLWRTVTDGAELPYTIIGKPHQPTYKFAEDRLRKHRKHLFGHVGLNDPLRKVYMIGDNPESDIRGANNYSSPYGSAWSSVLVRTGVYKGGEPAVKPTHIADDVNAAVEWALKDAKWT